MRLRALSHDAPDAAGSELGRWRRRQLERAGFARALAATLADDPRTDVHALLELVDRGCPPHLAARILAPLESRPGPSR
jgi:hypothetical protein